VAVSSGLTGQLKRVVLDLEGDLRQRVHADSDVLARWEQEHKEAVARERTAMSWQEWRDDRVTQAAVAWVLTTVFVRFCEDNRLLSHVWFAGPPERRQEALDAELEYFRGHPEHTDREWILQAIGHLRSVKATRELVESHSPLWSVSPSGQAAKRLVAFWRAKTADGDLVHDFTDADLSTRFLGDLYQDLSDYAKKTFALLQTPEFVEEFILDQTMEPALTERPLEGFRLIDPTCGSGHFLLGAFARLNDRWARESPGLEVQARVQKALDAIHGVDLNPFAVAIAKFRLIVAALQACGLTSLEDAPAFTLHLAAGDSLLHGGHQLSMQFHDFDADAEISGFAYATEDLANLHKILTPGRYDVVVGNPPYITVKDKTLNARYRELYSTCKGTYALTVPFMERFFQLAKQASADQPAGWTGQITSNSFMKREFGSKLIEDFLVRQDLRVVIDASGAFIPGHATPTVIVVARSAPPVGNVRAVLSIRAEAREPAIPSEGVVWRSIAGNIDRAPWEDDWITIADVPRETFARHPWSLTGGGADQLQAAIESAGMRRIPRGRVGKFGIIGADEPMVQVLSLAQRRGLSNCWLPVVVGSGVRDWRCEISNEVFFPYDASKSLIQELTAVDSRWLWPYRTNLEARSDFAGTYKQIGKPWFGWHQLPTDAGMHEWVLAWGEVATHNHFMLLTESRPIKQTALMIRLSGDASENDYFDLLSVLNSSTMAFWLHQVCYDKGSGGNGRGIATEQWEHQYAFNAANVAEAPLPSTSLPHVARALVEMAPERAVNLDFSATRELPSQDALEAGHARWTSAFERSVALQEELDWGMYLAYGLIDDDLTFNLDDLPLLSPGERAFEIVLARTAGAAGEGTEWFARHGSSPIVVLPRHWPEAYKQLVQRRIEAIECDKFIRLLEKPEHKRRWATEPWGKQVERALRSWLLDRLEDKRYWFDAQSRPAPKSIGQLADQVSRHADLVSVLELWSGTKDQSVTASLTALLADEGVPFLAAYRLKDSGLRKREAWEHTWDLQRREDAGEKVGDIPIPPKYISADFLKASWWQRRGKLDVPKERFILYPSAGRETDPTPVLGWAGWDHAQQALALATVIGAREAEGWTDQRLVPLVAGLAELQPWVSQWHDEVDPTYGVNLAEFCAEHLRDKAAQVGLTLDELHGWRPSAPTRGRRAKA